MPWSRGLHQASAQPIPSASRATVTTSFWWRAGGTGWRPWPRACATRPGRKPSRWRSTSRTSKALSELEARAATDERLELLVNNAGFGGYRRFAEIEAGVIDELIGVHIRAVARLTRAALPGMLRRGQGAVVNIASLLALSGALPPDPLPHRAVYAGAKAFILAFTEALSGELGESRVRVQACLPGLVDTEYHRVAGRDPAKMPPMMKAPDVVAASLAALKQGEVVCIPGLDDPALIGNFAELRRTILMKANRPGSGAALSLAGTSDG